MGKYSFNFLENYFSPLLFPTYCCGINNNKCDFTIFEKEETSKCFDNEKRTNVLLLIGRKVKAFRSKDKFHRKMGYSDFEISIWRYYSVLLTRHMGEGEEERKEEEEDFSFEVAGLSTVTSPRPSIATL